MADKVEKKEVAEKVEYKIKGTEEVVLVDKDGNEATTTKAFYDANVDGFKLTGFTKK